VLAVMFRAGTGVGPRPIGRECQVGPRLSERGNSSAATSGYPTRFNGHLKATEE
jgi:hypothetical protein